MSVFAFQVACLRLVADEPLFGIYAVPVDQYFDRISGQAKSTAVWAQQFTGNQQIQADT